MRTITEDAGSLASATVVAGVGAAVVSLVQCALGLLLIWVTAVGISLGDFKRGNGRIHRLVVGVDDPAQTVAAIRQALGTTG